MAAILSAMTRGGRLEINWKPAGDLARAEVKLLFLALQCLETAMAYGGRVTVAPDGERWTVTGQAPRMRIDVAVWELLSPPSRSTEITPALVHFPLLAEEMTRQKRRLGVAMRETEIRISL